MTLLRGLLAVALTLAAVWLIFVAALALLRPKNMSLQDAKRFIPDMLRLIRSLAKDETLPPRLRRGLGFLVGYLALPFDLIPDFIPVLGYADDVIVVALVLRSVVRAAGPTAVERHWQGSPAGLLVIHHLSGRA